MVLFGGGGSWGRSVDLLKEACHWGRGSFEVSKATCHSQCTFSASYLWFRRWALGCSSHNTCLLLCLPTMVMMGSYSSGTISLNKPFLHPSHIALVLVLYHSNRKVANTEIGTGKGDVSVKTMNVLKLGAMWKSSRPFRRKAIEHCEQRLVGCCSCSDGSSQKLWDMDCGGAAQEVSERTTLVTGISLGYCVKQWNLP